MISATAAVPGVLADWGLDGLDAVGHRIAHGGADFAQLAASYSDAPDGLSGGMMGWR